MKLGVCVVLYERECKSIKSYLGMSDCVAVVDNGNNTAPEDAHYISMNGNKGIAAALNEGINYLKNQGCSVVLTMDDDSIFPFESAEDILKIVVENISSYGILTINFNSFPEKKTDRIVDVKNWITSGNFVNLEAWEKTGGYREELFIDYVDFDFCARVKKAGYRIGLLEDYSIVQTIGSPIEFRVFGKTFHAMNHSAVRDYYRFRNARYLAREDFGTFGGEYLKEIFWQYPKMILFENNLNEKKIMIKQGKKDAKKGKLGKLE